MDSFLAQIGNVAADLAWLLGSGAVPWLLLLVVLLVRPPALGCLRGMIRSGYDSRYQHLRNLTRFRKELVKRESHVRLTPAVRSAPRDIAAEVPWYNPRKPPGQTMRDATWEGPRR